MSGPAVDTAAFRAAAAGGGLTPWHLVHKPIASVALMSTACSQQVSLTYAAASPLLRTGAEPTIARVVVEDQRNEADPTWIGAIRGGYGNPLKVLHLSQPLSESVGDAFREALKSRGLFASGGRAPYDLHVNVQKFQSTQMARREAKADIAIDVIDRATEKPMYHDQTSVDLVTANIFAVDTGIFASSSDLQAVAQNALNQAIDRLLDKPAFLAAVRGPVNAPS